MGYWHYDRRCKDLRKASLALSNAITLKKRGLFVQSFMWLGFGLHAVQDSSAHLEENHQSWEDNIYYNRNGKINLKCLKFSSYSYSRLEPGDRYESMKKDSQYFIDCYIKGINRSNNQLTSIFNNHKL